MFVIGLSILPHTQNFSNIEEVLIFHLNVTENNGRHHSDDVIKTFMLLDEIYNVVYQIYDPQIAEVDFPGLTDVKKPEFLRVKHFHLIEVPVGFWGLLYLASCL